MTTASSRPRVLVLVTLLALCGCRLPELAPLDAEDPAPTLAREAGVEAEIEFLVEGEPVDAPDVASAPAAPLTLADALRESLSHSPRVQRALAGWHAAKARCEELRVTSNPLLSVGVALARSLAEARVSVGISREIDDWFARPHRVDAADARLRAAAAEALVAAIDDVAATRAAYLAAQAPDAHRTALEERLALLTRERDVARRAFEAGSGLATDVTALDAARAVAALDLIENDAERTRARIELAHALGRPSAAADWRLEPWPALPPPVAEAREWLRAALRQRPDARAVEWELAALGAERELSGLWRFEGASYGVEAEWDEGLTVGPVAEFPLRLEDPSGPRDDALTAAESALRHRVVELLRAAVRDVRLALADERAARAALRSIDAEIVPLLESRRAALESSHRAGEVEITTLLRAEEDLQTARRQRVALEARVLGARLRLLRAAGGPPGPEDR